MDVITHNSGTLSIAETISNQKIICDSETALQLMGDLYFQGFDAMIVASDQITPEFFDLKTGLAGEILQKFSNYRMRLFIVGDFSAVSSKSLNDFIFESNKCRIVNFVASIQEAIARISATSV